MIKSEVSVCAVISRGATVKESKDGKSFVSFGCTIPLKGRYGDQRELELSVSCDGDKGLASILARGKRVEILGNLSIRKKDGKVYYNLRADGGVDVVKSSEPDKIEGEMTFSGKIGKNGVDVKNDKKGKPFQAFSAFSTDKDGDKAEFIWVRFLNFTPVEADFMRAGSYVDVKGDLQFSVYKSEISIDCRVKEIAQTVFNNNQ